MSGVVDKLKAELGSRYSGDFAVSVASQPLLSAWLGAADLAEQDPPEFTTL